jgi:hypothetical protein
MFPLRVVDTPVSVLRVSVYQLLHSIQSVNAESGAGLNVANVATFFSESF